MSQRPNLLVIAPYAPPQNAAEAIQVRRILAELDKHTSGRLITIAPDKTGWAKEDTSLALKLSHFDTQYLRLPLHRFTKRILNSHHLAWLHNPDAHGWILGQAGRIAASLKTKPDVIYSRSYPISAALLAQKLKAKLHVPWIMHLSDPWADSPYAKSSARAQQQEANAFVDADAVSVTTENQAQHYRNKYPAHATKIFVSPNIMPEPHFAKAAANDCLNIVFTGNLYSARSPEPLIHALAMLQPTERSNIRVDIYGNTDQQFHALLHSMPDVLHYHGSVSFDEAYRAQQRADMVLSIEPELSHPLGNAFMPSKVLEAIALGKPLLAITPAGSETEAICREGYGFAVSTPEALAAKLKECMAKLSKLRATAPKAPPERFSAKQIVAELLSQIEYVRVK